MRLRFWLIAMDVTAALRLPHAVWIWCLRHASDATDWGEVTECSGEAPF